MEGAGHALRKRSWTESSPYCSPTLRHGSRQIIVTILYGPADAKSHPDLVATRPLPPGLCSRHCRRSRRGDWSPASHATACSPSSELRASSAFSSSPATAGGRSAAHETESWRSNSSRRCRLRRRRRPAAARLDLPTSRRRKIRSRLGMANSRGLLFSSLLGRPIQRTPPGG